jgi:uncharacterized protein (TIGR03067 family)
VAGSIAAPLAADGNGNGTVDTVDYNFWSARFGNTAGCGASARYKSAIRPLMRIDSMASDLEEIQGTWKQIAYERDGLKEPLDEQGWEPRVTFSGNEFVVTLADGSVPIKGMFKLDATQRPKSMNLTDTFGADAGKTFLAVYSLEGDRLAFCAADEGQERPSSFETMPGQVLRVNQRVSV